jgi:hypothetical protein
MGMVLQYLGHNYVYSCRCAKRFGEIITQDRDGWAHKVPPRKVTLSIEIKVVSQKFKNDDVIKASY